MAIEIKTFYSFEPIDLGIDEPFLLRLLQDREFFRLAQLSYRKHFERVKKDDEEMGKKRRKPMRKEEEEILTDLPPYPRISQRMMLIFPTQVFRWRQIMENYSRDRSRLLHYSAETCLNPEHQEKHNLAYPPDHPFWSLWYPPNSFPCYCQIQDLTADGKIYAGA